MAHPGGAWQIGSEPGAILAGYKPRPGNFDEMMDQDGRVREHWQPFVRILAELGVEEIERRFAIADRHLRDSGIFYRVYEDPAGAVRPWPLSHIPLLIDPTEWRALQAGLIQRAELLEAVLKDIYGPADLVREGRLPATVVAGNPEFLRPLVDAVPVGGTFLRLYAVDVGRSPQGQWWVLGDRTQAPSGAGFALENRIALSSGMPDVYRALRVQRLAPFFQALQAAMSALNSQDDSRVCVLTPGPLNETYFEHAYLARYLGFLLVEGEDLTVREDGVFIRTVSGLRRAEVLLRRLDSDFADPLELSARSRLGVPGLVQAVRDGRVVIANALGSGAVEARAMLSFLPALAPAVLGEEIAIPNVATWWLGDPERRREVLDRLDEVVIGSAFAGNLGDGGGETVHELLPGSRQRLMEAIQRRGIDFVAQEPVTLSTMPAWQDGRLVPKAFVLRLLLARTDGGWRVMPGGFVRVADARDARAVNLQMGGRTADVWVLSDQPVAPTTMLPAPDRIAINRATGALPSRAAANLFWLGRYLERTEATLRLVRALLNRANESDRAAIEVGFRICALLNSWGAVPDDMLSVSPVIVASAALQQRNGVGWGSLASLVASAHQAASVIREHFSPDAWRALTDLIELIDVPLEPGVSEGVLSERVNAALRITASFSGLAQENMSQLAGWRFLEVGRRIERAIATCRFARQFACGDNPEGALDVLLELADSQITYRLRYVMVAARALVVDLVALDPNNPRSVVFQISRIESHLAALPKHGDDSRLSPPQQIATALMARIRTADVVQVDQSMLVEIETALMKLSDVIAETYFTMRPRSEPSWEATA